MSNKKYATAIICLSPNNGGMEIDTMKLAKKISPYTDTILIAKKFSFIANQQDFYSKNNILLKTINFHLNFSFNIILHTRKIIQKYNIKNIIFFGASELRSLYFSFLGLDINLIVRHGTTKSKPKKDLFHKLIYSKVNYHVSICKHIQKNVEYIIPFEKNTISKLIYSSLNPKQSTSSKTTHQKLTLLHVGRIAKAKGQIDAIAACSILFENNIDFKLLLIGSMDDNYKDEFMQHYAACPYKNNIDIIGFTDNVNSFLTNADIFIFPSHGEGLSNAFLEALANNLVCISYNNTSFPELKNFGLHFKMAPDQDIHALQETLLSIVLNLEQERSYSEQNKQIIKEQFSEQREITQYLEILK